MKCDARRTAVPGSANCDHAIAMAYNQAGEEYVTYADGNPTRLFAFDGRYGYGDRQIWDLLDTRFRALYVSGAETVRILVLSVAQCDISVSTSGGLRSAD